MIEGKTSEQISAGSRLIGMTRTLNDRLAVRLHPCGTARWTRRVRLEPRTKRIRIVFLRAPSWIPAIHYSSQLEKFRIGLGG